MINFLRRLERQDLCVLLFTISFVGLLYSKLLLSICLLSLIPLALLHIEWEPKLRIGIRKNSKAFFQVYLGHPPYWALGITFLVILFSALYTGTSDYWMDRVRIKAPLLIAPILVAFVPPLSRKHIRSWMLALLGIAVLSLIGILVNYFMNYDSIQEGLKKGQAIPVFISHIRYSLFISFAVILGLWLSYTEKTSRRIKLFAVLSVIFLLIGLHILSVRSGLLATYLMLFLAIVYATIDLGNWRVAIAGLFCLVLIPLAALKWSPSLQTRLSYASYDFKQYLEGNGANYSDAERLISLKVGWNTFLENKWLGTGVANFRSSIREKYKTDHPTLVNQKLPHSQYISWLASVGIVGTLITLFALMYPLFWGRQYRYFPLAALYLVMLTSMLFENTLETTVGLNLFLMPTLIMLNHLSANKVSKVAKG